MSQKRGDFLASAVLFALIAGCSGDGCDCVTPIPGGFPDDDRVDNALQVRVSSSGIAALEADPAALIGGLIGSGGGLTFDIPSSCGGDPEVCCTGGTPVTPCGPIELDLVAQAGDAPRLEVTPQQGSSTLNVVLRARVKTSMDFPIKAVGLNCLVEIDTEMDTANDDIKLETTVQFVQDPDTGTTKLVVGDVTISQFDNGDVSLKAGDFLCVLADLATGLFIDTLVGTFEDAIKDTITDQVCKQCSSGDVADCGPHADSCDSNVCMKGGECLQELGLTGRMTAASLLGSLSPGTLGAIDVYDVAGGYATTDDGGISLGVLGGMLPAGEERDRCGPSATAPTPATIPQSSFFQGNTRPDTNAPFDFAFGLHQHNLEMFAYSSYESGFLCLSIGTRTVDLLTSETMAVIFPSLIDLLHAESGQIVLGLRPQSPPTIALGLNTYRMEGGDRVIDDPLLDINFTAMEIDFFGLVDDQWIRLMTLTTDINLPINLEVDGAGEITPVLGDVENGFTNLSVSNSEALVESPTELADKFPALLSLAVPLIADGLGGFALPELGGLKLKIAPDGITAVDNKSFMAIFGTFDLTGSMAASPRVNTHAELVQVHVPDRAAFSARTWDRSKRPMVEIAVGGTLDNASRSDLEWSYRLDNGLWSPYSPNRTLRISRPSLWLQGRHSVQVRSRVVGKPETTDLTPVLLHPIIDRTAPRARFASPMPDTLYVAGRDNVGGRAVKVEYRLGDGTWTEADGDPAFVQLDGHRAEEVSVRLTDAEGNTTITSPVVGFHGTGGAGSGCECRAIDEQSRNGGLVLMLLVCLALFARRRRQLARLTRRGVARAVTPLLSGAIIVLSGAFLQAGCSCGGTTVECFGGECAEGEVERGPIGRYSDIAVTPDRAVVSAYDEQLGDLVLGEISAEGQITFQAVDGVPDEPPVFEPSTYRNGIAGPGANVGAWTSVALTDGRAHIAYQDIDRGLLKFAYETGDGWLIHDVDPSIDGVAGLYSSVSIGPNGSPAIAFMVVGVDDTNGVKLSQLRYAQAANPSPASESDWAVAILDEAPISCAGLCASGTQCIDDTTMVVERCVAASSDCATACGMDQTCSGGVCYADIPDPSAYDLPGGTGLFANLAHLPDGRPIIVYYDRLLGDLSVQVFDSTWNKQALDAATATDTGQWASIAVDSGGTVHIAYQDALGDQLLYTSWSSGTVGAIEVVDDGTRAGDRPHNVGASASIVLQAGGEPAIVYQDGATSNVLVARRSGGTWAREDLLAGPNLYGFYIRAGTDGSRVLTSSYMYDRTIYPPGELVITTIP